MATALRFLSHSNADGSAPERPARREHAAVNPVTPDDDTVVARVRSGDGDALEILFRTHVAGLTSAVVGYVESIDVAEDVVQDVFFAIWRSRTTWSPPTSVVAYLYRAARNRALDVRKHARVVAAHRNTSHTAELAGSDPSAELEATELAEQLERSLAKLPPRTREVFTLYRDARLSYQEIAVALGISINTVYVQMGRAVEALQAVPRRLGSE